MQMLVMRAGGDMQRETGNRRILHDVDDREGAVLIGTGIHRVGQVHRQDEENQEKGQQVTGYFDVLVKEEGNPHQDKGSPHDIGPGHPTRQKEGHIDHRIVRAQQVEYAHSDHGYGE